MPRRVLLEGESKTLTFPWGKGLTVDSIMADSTDHIDWVYPSTGTKMLKAQHPEFDLSQQGIHAAAGVGCADCHMPYKREGAVKLTDHHIRSPLLMVNNACQSCHSVSEDDLNSRVKTIQDRFIHSRDVAMDSLLALITDLEKAQTDGTEAKRIEVARSYHRKASFFIDYLYSENSYGFHAPAESGRIFADAIDAARKGQAALAGTVTEPAELDGPDQSGPAPSPKPANATATPTPPATPTVTAPPSPAGTPGATGTP
ncbi:nitrite reductase (cytochrome c-552) [Kineosphaera limosa]|uniref:nitrite reductase (cytochrome; ammonia-forming) n=1 Tax=Kineosphaera limosa NBRC 100340 TaxID=1184609 RepID=K6WQ38_9MICO|nr:ammonia-forming cytochrome c nitrite reductase subunit c552 [Kineosphaera limosa]NYE02796.1 nitrite reductase (cytochrome c-552) [Kineosphaera limosa]GAB94227.1 cytochrome c-552 [Kineosphaera limosa NBRC 100340]